MCVSKAHRLYSAERATPPLWPDRVHWYGGRLLVLVAFAAVLLGVKEIGGGLGFKTVPGAFDD